MTRDLTALQIRLLIDSGFSWADPYVMGLTRRELILRRCWEVAGTTTGARLRRKVHDARMRPTGLPVPDLPALGYCDALLRSAPAGPDGWTPAAAIGALEPLREPACYELFEAWLVVTRESLVHAGLFEPGAELHREYRAVRNGKVWMRTRRDGGKLRLTDEGKALGQELRDDIALLSEATSGKPKPEKDQRIRDVLDRRGLPLALFVHAIPERLFELGLVPIASESRLAMTAMLYRDGGQHDGYESAD